MIEAVRAWLWRLVGRETLWGDGWHDDAPAFSAALAGRRIRRAYGKSGQGL